MNENIRRLVRLQEIVFEIRDLTTRRDAVPGQIAELEQAFQQKIEEIGADRLNHETLVQEVASLRTEDESNRLRLGRAQQKLMQVSNQREYSAVLNEIDATKAELSRIEAAIETRQARIEELAEPAAAADGRIAEERRKVEEEKARIAQDLEQVNGRLEELTGQREEIVEQLPAPFVQRFDTIIKKRNGIVMARVEGGACSACHVRLRPHLINLVRRGTDLISCESCRRFLYVAVAEPEEASEDSSTPPAGDGDGAAGRSNHHAPAGS